MDKKELFKDACDWLEDEGYDVTFHESYSGRGMFGDSVPAISGEVSGVMVGLALAKAGEAFDLTVSDLQWQGLIPTGRDSLGLGTIYY